MIKTVTGQWADRIKRLICYFFLIRWQSVKLKLVRELKITNQRGHESLIYKNLQSGSSSCSWLLGNIRLIWKYVTVPSSYSHQIPLLQAESRTSLSVLKTSKRKLTTKQVSSDADVNESGTTSEEFHSDSTQSTKKVHVSNSAGWVIISYILWYRAANNHLNY